MAVGHVEYLDELLSSLYQAAQAGFHEAQFTAFDLYLAREAANIITSAEVVRQNIDFVVVRHIHFLRLMHRSSLLVGKAADPAGALGALRCQKFQCSLIVPYVRLPPRFTSSLHCIQVR